MDAKPLQFRDALGQKDLEKTTALHSAVMREDLEWLKFCCSMAPIRAYRPQPVNPHGYLQQNGIYKDYLPVSRTTVFATEKI
jgi:hypothetical protein